MPEFPLVGACVRGVHGYSLARMGVWLAKRLAGRSQSPQPRTKDLLGGIAVCENRWPLGFTNPYDMGSVARAAGLLVHEEEEADDDSDG